MTTEIEELRAEITALEIRKVNLARAASNYYDRHMFGHAEVCDDDYDKADDEIARLKDEISRLEALHAWQCRARRLNLSEY